MLMHVLDPGRRMGRALGNAGEIPRSDSVILRKPKEDRSVGHGNMIACLTDVWKHRRPDLVVFEEPMSVAAWFRSNQKRDFPTSPEGVESGFELSALITGCCARFGIPFRTVRRQSVLSHMTGTSKHGSREAGKKAVILACIRAGLVEVGCTDDDRCDAVANFVYASAMFARKPVGNFHLTA